MKLRSGLLAGLILLGLAAPAIAAADNYPNRQIKIIVNDDLDKLLSEHRQDGLEGLFLELTGKDYKDYHV